MFSVRHAFAGSDLKRIFQIFLKVQHVYPSCFQKRIYHHARIGTGCGITKQPVMPPPRLQGGWNFCLSCLEMLQMPSFRQVIMYALWFHAQVKDLARWLPFEAFSLSIHAIKVSTTGF